MLLWVALLKVKFVIFVTLMAPDKNGTIDVGLFSNNFLFVKGFTGVNGLNHRWVCMRRDDSP